MPQASSASGLPLASPDLNLPLNCSHSGWQCHTASASALAVPVHWQGKFNPGRGRAAADRRPLALN